MRRPAFALLAVLTIGLGIGAATAIFGLVRAVVLEPLPYPEADRLVEVLEARVKAVPAVEPVARSLDGVIAGPRFNFVLMLVFGTVALTLAVMGVYGVTHLAVSRRSREIGIRMARGGSVIGMVGMVVRRSAGLAIVGIALGLALAIAGARTIQTLLFRTSPLDPAILGAAAAVLLACALVAAWIPARRAASVDPVSVSRAD